MSRRYIVPSRAERCMRKHALPQLVVRLSNESGRGARPPPMGWPSVERMRATYGLCEPPIRTGPGPCRDSGLVLLSEDSGYEFPAAAHPDLVEDRRAC